ncbi:MAG: hypothetical protein LC737_01950 [Chloroflexi bacterium]|nr:hypothetical protein [Chloroflexota bacterium]
MKRVRWWPLIVVALSVLSCGANLNPLSPTPPTGSIRPSSAAADELERTVRNQLFDPSKREFRIAVSNQQATSYAVLRNGNIPLENLQIWFTQGKVFVRGTYTAMCLFHPEVLVIAAPRAQDGKIQANVEQIYVGAFTLPHDWLPTVSKSISDTIEDAQIKLNLERIEIREGEFIVGGSKRS